MFRCTDDSLGFLPRFLHFPVIYDHINYLKTIGVKEYIFQKMIILDILNVIILTIIQKRNILTILRATSLLEMKNGNLLNFSQ